MGDTPTICIGGGFGPRLDPCRYPPAPTRRSAEMSENTGKVSKAVVNPEVVKAYAGLAAKTRKDEIAFINNMASRLAAGTVSVKVLSSSIREASKTAQAPTVRASHAQEMQRAALILSEAKGVEAAPLRAVLTMATRLRKGTGSAEAGDALAVDLIARAVPFSEWDDIVPATNKKDEDGEGEGPAKVAGTADEIIAAALASLRELDDVTVTDKQTAAALIKMLQGLIR